MSNPKTSCIEHGYPTPYPMIRVNGKMVNGQRLVWQLAYGRAMPKGLVVRHTCDNPRCINPAHLKAGTQAKNLKDAADRGRSRPYGKTPVSQADKALVLNAAVMGNTYVEIARRIGRSTTTVRRIINGQS